MWIIIKNVIIVVAFLWQLYLVFQAESVADQTGDYGHVTYELLWLILLFFIGESVLKEENK